MTIPDKTRRLLRSVPEEAIFHGTDPEDPRFGDLLTPIDEIPATASIVAVIVGIPQHIGVERNGGRPGAEEAPRAIRMAFTKLATSAVEHAIKSERLVICDAGDIDTNGKTLEQIHDEQHDVVSSLLHAGCIPILLGGGHDTAWPTIRAMNYVGEPFGVINIDAHADVRPLIDDVRSHSGSPFRQMLTEPSSALAPASFLEFGLQQTSVSRSHLDLIAQYGMHAVMLDHIRERGVRTAWDDALLLATQSASKLYVSLDMDAVASAYAPGVSAPAAAGFTPEEVLHCVRAAATHRALCAFDIVEVNPRYDVDGRTAKLAGLVLAEVIAGLADRLGPS